MLSAVKNFFLTFLLSVVIFGMVASMAVGIITKNINGTIGEDEGTATAEVTLPGGIVPAQDDTVGGESLNILLIGSDYRPSTLAGYDPEALKMLYGIEQEEDAGIVDTPDDLASPARTGNIIGDSAYFSEDGIQIDDNTLVFKNGFYSVSYRTVQADTVVLLRIDKERGNITYTSFPTDAYVQIGGSYLKLADVYGLYGVEVLKDKIHAMTGLGIDRYASVCMEDFPGLIDALGGVAFYVPCNMQYDDYAGDLHISLGAGRQQLTGQECLELLAFNSYTDGVNSRTRTTVLFLEALMSSLTNISNYTKIGDFVERVNGMVLTDITSADIVKNTDLVFGLASSPAEISAVTTKKQIDGETVTVIDETATVSAFSNFKRIYN